MSDHIKLRLTATLKQLKRIFSKHEKKDLTNQDISTLAGVSKRCVDEWMRGTNAPTSMAAILELLSKLPEDDVIEILDFWKNR